MKFIVIKTIILTTKELYEIEIAEYHDPLHYLGSSTPVSTVTERELKCDIFKKEVDNEKG